MKFRYFKVDDRIPQRNAGNTKHLITRFEDHTKVASYDIVIKATSMN